MIQDDNMKRAAPVAVCGFAVMTLAFGAESFADSITLKNAVRLVGDAKVVTLADIAEIDGHDASRYSNLHIADINTPGSVMEISVKDVRTALEQAGVNWALVNLSGRKVIVRPSRDGSAEAPIAMAGASLGNAKSIKAASVPSQPSTADAIVSSGTIRGQVADRIVAGLHVDPKNLRLNFDDGDAAFLDSGLDTMRLEIDPQSSFNSDRIALTLRLWSDNRVQSQRTISVQPLLLIKAATAMHDIEKDQIIAEENLASTDQWLPPSQVALTISLPQAVGRSAAKKLNAGEVIRDKSIRRDAIVKRGEQVTVRCLVGGVAISMQAEARADGSEGDVIELRKQGERDTFRATVTGRAEAVVDLRQKQAPVPTNS